MHGELAESSATIMFVLECEVLTHCVGSYVEQAGLCKMYFLLSRECSLAVLCRVCLMEKMLLTVFFKKYSASTLPCKRTIHKRVENSSASGSVLYKNKIQKLVFFLDEAWCMLSRNVNIQINSCWYYPMKIAKQFVKFSLRDIKVW
jgi:hypothetical protein